MTEHIAALVRRAPTKDEATSDRLLEAFLDYAMEKGLELYAAQEEAILELFSGSNVILNTPTGSGKSLVATAACFKTFSEGGRAFYTAPIKALVSEKFFAMCRDFGPENVGMMTGDASVNRDAPIICCTAEILANLALVDGAKANVDLVVMDEFHYYADRERGVAWQVPLLELSNATFLLMSATLGDTTFFEEAVTTLTGRRCAIVKTMERPVPLDFVYRETPLHETIADLLETKRSPIYIVHFTQRAAAEQAQDLMSVDILVKEQKKAIDDAMHGFRFDTPWGKDLKRYLKHGVGVHHAGLLPKYRLLVEKLAQKGHLKIICGTDTLGVGVNIPIRTVLFTQLCKFDGEKTAILSVRDFKQIAGRAGRKGFDDAGTVVAQAPEHVIENRALEGKAGGDAKKLRKLVRKKPPDRGYAHWDESTFKRLIDSPPEKLTSQFSVSHGMLLHVLGRPNGCAAMKALIRKSHDGPPRQRRNGRLAIAMFRSLLEARVIEMDREGLRANEDLQQDFSLNQALSLYVLETLPLLDKESPEYAVDVLTLVEAVLEDPGAVLLRQLDELRGMKVNELKAQGMEYDDRMAELEKLEHPKPRREFVYETFNAFADRHPWVGAENIRAKSVARDMYERGTTFVEYVKELGLERSEGVLLRYLTDAYKAMVQNVPESAKTPESNDLTEWLGAVVKQIDSSLIDEWERMKDPDAFAEKELVRLEKEEERVSDITTDERAFSALIRNELFRLVKLLSAKRFDRAAMMVEPDQGEPPWTADRLAEKLAPYFEEYPFLRIDATARSPKNVTVEKYERAWYARQTLVDPEEHLSWSLEARVDLARAIEEQRPVLELIDIKQA